MTAPKTVSASELLGQRVDEIDAELNEARREVQTHRFHAERAQQRVTELDKERKQTMAAIAVLKGETR